MMTSPPAALQATFFIHDITSHIPSALLLLSQLIRQVGTHYSISRKVQRRYIMVVTIVAVVVCPKSKIRFVFMSVVEFTSAFLVFFAVSRSASSGPSFAFSPPLVPSFHPLFSLLLALYLLLPH
ncbi:hypothetical protein BKA82DRAFT_1005125 [Pisolithus tinctorius]|uniref:Uncharacterized protein n=1 Tax=Pisolithus tinctorius Marx 270 TaxID=870435 RepID=A0A0C3NT29_PISTI|nr:hypothetical protein BKA82DRAFT_1005125 [Pisolithus tinctorius]KIN98645.1 hypothetical protein M404DRAFT_1005125 [Pisolithus tinctorius Marx 270]